MIFPDTIKIGGHSVSVEICSDEKTQGLGECYHKYNRLRILKDQSPSQQDETLLHEIFEYIIHANELKLEHGVLTCLSEQLFQVLRDNRLAFYDA